MIGSNPSKKELNSMTLEYQEIMEETMQEEYNKQHNAVNHPSHYNTNNPIIRVKCECGKVIEVPVECIDVIRDMPTWKGNAVKYLWREGLKSEEGMSPIDKEIEDCRKAVWYILDHISNLEKKKLCLENKGLIDCGNSETMDSR